MPEIEVTVEIWCATCGAGLCNESTGIVKRGRPGVEVAACATCLNNEYRRALDEGYAKGFDEARDRFS